MNYERNEILKQQFKRLIEGDISALEKIYMAVRKGLMGFAKVFLKNEYDAEDIVHDFMIDLTKKAKKLKNSNNIYAWMNKAFENMIKDKLRKINRHPQVSLESAEHFTVENDEDNPAMRVKFALEKLETEERSLVYYIFWHGLSLSEISTLITVPKSTIEYRVNKIKDKLKTFL